MAAKPSSLLMRRRIQVRGVVQGVGFRPFVYNLAHRLGLAGYALNSSAGVTIELQGDDTHIEQFLRTLTDDPPPLARIETVQVVPLEPNRDTAFSIRDSQSLEGEFALVAADVGTCNDCWREFSDPSNRRYQYAFTNCTNCGPVTPSCRTCPMIARPRRCRPFACARAAKRNTTTLGTDAFMLNPTHARCADHN